MGELSEDEHSGQNDGDGAINAKFMEVEERERVYCDRVGAKSRSGERDAVAESELTGETERHELRGSGKALVGFIG